MQNTASFVGCRDDFEVTEAPVPRGLPRPNSSQTPQLAAFAPLRRWLPTAGGGTTQNVGDGSIQHQKSSAIGWKRMLFPVANITEVDKYYDLLNILETAGYLGAYKRRTGGSVDGCAMFWKADKFQLLEGESIEFRQYGLRDNVAQLSVFEMREAQSRRLVVGNIHVLYNPSRGDVKLGQIRFLSSKAHILSEKWDHVPIVLAGDYNSTPQSNLQIFVIIRAQSNAT
ncbi:Carbon catabolite repressor protein 4 -like protein 3 [Capsicum annuum]|nr:Carbon catabolite repressor protein 4 -like protein 3 [Capsicum annuum]